MKGLTKKFILLITVMGLSFLVACGGEDSEETGNNVSVDNSDNNSGDNNSVNDTVETKTLQVGITLAEDSHYYEGLEHFGELVEEKSNGELAIEIFANGSLGGERDMVESLQVGTLDMVLSSTGPLGSFVPEINVVDLPFLFESREHAYEVLDGEVGQDLLNSLEDSGIKGLSWWENGFRHITNSERPVVTPEDLDGLKIRTMENEVHMDSFEEMGASPTPMSFTELFTALQQGVVHGQENPVPIILTSRFYEVQDYMSLTGHFYSPAALLISQQVFDGFTDSQQQAFQEASNEAATFEREVVANMEKDMVAELKESGMQIEENIDKKLFQDATNAVYEQYEDQFGVDLIEQIKDASK